MLQQEKQGTSVFSFMVSDAERMKNKQTRIRCLKLYKTYKHWVWKTQVRLLWTMIQVYGNL